MSNILKRFLKKGFDFEDFISDKTIRAYISFAHSKCLGANNSYFWLLETFVYNECFCNSVLIV